MNGDILRLDGWHCIRLFGLKSSWDMYVQGSVEVEVDMRYRPTGPL
jgi:hypothetical protein